MPRKRIERTKLLVSIVNPSDDARLTEALSDVTRLLHYTFVGKGTARSNIMDYFGLTSAEKSIVISVIPESLEKKLLTVAVETLKLYLVGKGIAFTVPLTSISTLIADAVVTDKAPAKGENKMPNGPRYDLIAAVYNQNLSDVVVEATRQAGAVGGTLLNARALSSTGVEQFVGVSLGETSEILLIITKREGRNKIMQAIRDVAGLKTEGGGVVMSLPVDALVGIGTISEEYHKTGTEEQEE